MSKPEKPMVGYSAPEEIKGVFLGKPDPALMNVMEKFGSKFEPRFGLPTLNGQQPNTSTQRPKDNVYEDK